MTPERLPDPIRVALSVAATLERLGVPYVAVGSLASSVHGAPRSTDDVDFLVASVKVDLFVVGDDPFEAERLAQRWAERLSVADLLERALREGGPE